LLPTSWGKPINLPEIQRFEESYYKYDNSGCVDTLIGTVTDIVAILLDQNHRFHLQGPCLVTGCREDNNHSRTLKLKDQVPCYDLELIDTPVVAYTRQTTHRHENLVKHWYLDSLQDKERVLLSLVTNSYRDILAKLASFTRNSDIVGAHFLEIRE